MLNFRDKEIALDVVEFLAGGRKGINIPRGDFLSALWLRMSGTVTVASSSAGAVLDDGAMGLCTFVVTADAREIKRLPGRLLYYDNIARFGFAGEETDPTGASDAAYPVACEWVIPFAPAVKNPSGLYLPTAKYESLRLEVEWQPVSTLWNAAQNGTLTPSSMQVEVVGIYSRHPDQLTQLANPQATFPLYVQNAVEEVMSASASEFKLKMEKGDARTFFTDFTILTTDAGVRDADVINTLAVRYDTDVYRARNLSEYFLQWQWKRLSAQATEYTGVYVVNLLTDGLPNSAASAAERLEIVCNTTIGSGTTKFLVLRSMLVG